MASPKSRTAAHERLEEIELAFAALAHEQRRHILLTLHFRDGEMSAGAIADRFACAWPTTTRHLKELEAAKLVVVERRGRERIYKLNREHLERVVGSWLAVFTTR